MQVGTADEVIGDWPMSGFHIAVQYMSKECATRYFVRDDAHPRSEAVFVLEDQERASFWKGELDKRWSEFLAAVKNSWYGGDDGP